MLDNSLLLWLLLVSHARNWILEGSAGLMQTDRWQTTMTAMLQHEPADTMEDPTIPPRPQSYFGPTNDMFSV